MIRVYVNKDLKGKMERLKEWMKNRKKGIKVSIKRDFNARTGKEKGELEMK